MLCGFPMVENSLATKLTTFHYTPTIMGLSAMILESICNYQFTLISSLLKKISKLCACKMLKQKSIFGLSTNPLHQQGFFPIFRWGIDFISKVHCIFGSFGEMGTCCIHCHHQILIKLSFILMGGGRLQQFVYPFFLSPLEVGMKTLFLGILACISNSCSLQRKVKIGFRRTFQTDCTIILFKIYFLTWLLICIVHI